MVGLDTDSLVWAEIAYVAHLTVRRISRAEYASAGIFQTKPVALSSVCFNDRPCLMPISTSVSIHAASLEHAQERRPAIILGIHGATLGSGWPLPA